MLAVGEVLAGRFVIEAHVESGGMGSVFRAADRAGTVPVAVKTLEGGAGADVERARREALVLSELRHPGIVRYIAHGSSGFGEPFVVMEWLDGCDLARRLERQGLTADESVRLGRHVAEALAYAHERGIVHRDIKPANLFLCGGSVDGVKIVDFGIARSVRPARALTRAGWMLGTPGYIAPEQARGDLDVGPAADVFSLGCVLFECLTGHPPFMGEHPMAMLAKILLAEAPRVSSLVAGVPGELDDLVHRMLAKDAAARPRDGGRVRAELAALGALDDRARPVVLASSPPPALTGSEQQLFTVILSGARHAAPQASHALTVKQADDKDDLDALRRRLGALGARVDKLAGDVVVATLAAHGTASDQAARAARSALLVRDERHGGALVVATGRGVLAGALPVGEVIERAVALLARTQSDAADDHPVVLDDVTAGLLDERFEVVRQGGVAHLAAERRAGEPMRTLLGKPTSCVGRERELGLLAATLDECAADGVARAVLVAAPAGVGKSRLRYEFLRRVERRDDGTAVWFARGDAMSGGAPFGLVSRALRRAIDLQDGEALAVRRERVRAWVTEVMGATDAARVSDFVGELVGTPFPSAGNVALEAARADPMLMSDRLRLAFVDVVGALVARAPLLVVLEDLQWGDLPSVQFVDAVLRTHREAPLMVLALGRPDTLEEFPKLWAGRNLQVVELGELTKRASERLVRELLPAASAALVERVVERAAGNAFYLEELIRSVAEGHEDALPETVVAMVQGRLQALCPEQRRLLRAASVFGPVFWEGGVRELIGDTTRTLASAAWAELAAAEVVSERPSAKFPSERELVFRSVLLREAAYAMLTDADRALGHRLAGNWLELVGESDASVLAGHFERGREPARAAHAYRRAAEQALEGNDPVRAVAVAECGLAADPAGPEVGSLRLVAADALAWQGRLAESSAAAVAAMAALEVGSAAWFRAAGEAAATSGRRGDKAALCEHLARLRAAVGVGDALCQKIGAGSQAARQLYKVGLAREADVVCDELEALAAGLDPAPPLVRAACHLARASQALHAGDLGTFLDFTERATERFDAAGDLRNACTTRMGIGYAYLELGVYAEAEQALRAGAALAERLGVMGTLAAIKHNLGLTLALRAHVASAGEPRDAALATAARFAEAETLEREALAMFEQQGDVRFVGATRNYLGRILALAGRRADAESVLRATLASEPSNPAVRANALAMLVDVLLPARPDEARALARQAMAVVEEHGGIEAGEALIRLAYADSLFAAGDSDAAERAADVASERLLARASRITSARYRESFLGVVPENARTLALVTRLRER